MDDKLSDLHNSILILILSLLPTPDSVRTCTLSKRFRQVWASVPVLNFTINSDADVAFIDHVLGPRYTSPLISSFRISSPNGLGTSRVSDWVRYVVARNVDRDLKLDFGQHYSCKTPTLGHIVDRCGYLETLKLSLLVEQPLRIPLTPFFENLRILKLNFIPLPNMDLIGEFISNCTNLEFLCLKATLFNLLRFTGPNIRRLELEVSHCSKVHISCPRLTELGLVVGSGVEDFLVNMPALRLADIKLSDFCECWGQIFDNFDSVETCRYY